MRARDGITGLSGPHAPVADLLSEVRSDQEHGGADAYCFALRQEAEALRCHRAAVISGWP